ncbi:MAG: hypothetical protein ABEH43_11250, partial [Flavobacteriales bacterium]
EKVNNSEIAIRFIDNEKLSEQTKSFNKEFVPEKGTAFMNHGHSFSLGNSTKLFGKKLGYVFGLTYSRSFSHYENGQIGRYTLAGSKAVKHEKGVLNEELLLNDERSTQKVLWGSIIKTTLRLSSDHKLSLS